MKSKKEILEETQKTEEAIAEEIHNLKEDVWQKVKIGLTITFVGFGTYWLLKKYLNYPLQYKDLMPQVSQKEESAESKVASTKEELDIIQTIKKEIAVFLLAIAKQKIQELLQRLYHNENGEENTE